MGLLTSCITAKKIHQHESNMHVVEIFSCGLRNQTEQDIWEGDMSIGACLSRNHSKPSYTGRTAPFYEFLKNEFWIHQICCRQYVSSRSDNLMEKVQSFTFLFFYLDSMFLCREMGFLYFRVSKNTLEMEMVSLIKIISFLWWRVHYIGAVPRWLMGYLWVTCGWLVGDLWVTCGWIVGDLRVNWGWLVGDLWVICRWFAGDLQVTCLLFCW